MSKMPYCVTHDQEEGYCYVKGPGVFEAFSDEESHTASTVTKHLNTAYLAGKAAGKLEAATAITAAANMFTEGSLRRAVWVAEALVNIGYDAASRCKSSALAAYQEELAALSRSGGRENG